MLLAFEFQISGIYSKKEIVGIEQYKAAACMFFLFAELHTADSRRSVSQKSQNKIYDAKNKQRHQTFFVLLIRLRLILLKKP
jgi:hypothetical protein